MRGTKRCGLLMVFLGALALNGCQTTYYAVWEKLGKEKRHLPKDQVEEARDEQQEASEQFQDALSRLKELYGFEGGDLERFYNKLKDDYEECEERAMKKARPSMDPVLKNLRDYVLYLKHNLNAQAIGALKREVTDIEVDVQQLIRDMTASIQEADDFVKTLD